MDQPILITGAAGFIGFHLSRRLLENGYAVVGLDNLNDYYSVTLKQDRLAVLSGQPKFTFVQGDLADPETVEQLFCDYAPSVVVNLAAQAGVRYSIDHPRTYIDSNVVGFLNILEAVRAHPVRHLLFASSSSVYGNRDKTPFSVNDRVDRPISLYAATKKADELMAYTYAHLYGVPATGLRFFTVYGPFGRPDMAYFKFADKIYAGKPIEVYNGGDLYRDFTYVEDVVDCVCAMLNTPPAPDGTGAKYKIYNIGNNRPVQLLRFIQVLEEALGKRATLTMLPMQPGDVYTTCADISETAADFGYAPKTPIEQGLPLFADWYKGYCKIR